MAVDAVAPARPAGTGRWLARSQGLAVLAAVAAAGALLSMPGATGPPPADFEVSADPPSAWLLLPPGEAPAGPVIISRVPAAFDPRRSLLELGDGRERVVPRGARTVLVHADGRVEAFRPPLLSDTIIRLLRSIPLDGRAAMLGEWASGTKRFPHAAGLDGRLRAFLRRS